MNYQRQYDALIFRARNRQKPEGYVERHHVVPTALNGKNEPGNLVQLTAREHYLAHLILAKIHGGPMWRAFYLMSNRMSRKGSRLYEMARLEFSLSQTGDLHPMRRLPILAENHRKFMKGENNPARREEVRAKMRIVNRGENNPMFGKGGGFKGKKHTDETKAKITGRPKKV